MQRALSAELTELTRVDELLVKVVDDYAFYIHRDHRWVLPIIHQAQQCGTIPTPVDLAMFDAHHDALEPRCLPRIQEIRNASPTTDTLIDLCRNHLSQQDDDWLLAAMHLGLVGNAVIFGVHECGLSKFPLSFRDAVGAEHCVEIMGLPGRELQYQGRLSDIARRREHERTWGVLGWCRPMDGIFSIRRDSKLILDFDLDCFVVPWREYYFPWPEEVWSREFCEPSHYFTTDGLSGRDFVSQLAASSGLITIATEPNHCGGEQKAALILADAFKYFFQVGVQTSDKRS